MLFEVQAILNNWTLKNFMIYSFFSLQVSQSDLTDLFASNYFWASQFVFNVVLKFHTQNGDIHGTVFVILIDLSCSVVQCTIIKIEVLLLEIENLFQ